MAFEWICDQPSGFPGASFVAAVRCEPEPEMKWKEEKLTFRLRGFISLDICNSEESEDIVFYEEEYQPYLKCNVPWANYDGFLEVGRHASCDFYFPEDPRFENLFSSLEAPERPIRLPQPTALPPTGRIGPCSMVSYCVTVEIADEVSGRLTKSTLPVRFFMVREHVNVDPVKCGNICRLNSDERGLPEIAKIELKVPMIFAPERPFEFLLRYPGDPALSKRRPRDMSLQRVKLSLREHIKISNSGMEDITVMKDHEIWDGDDLGFDLPNPDDAITLDNVVHYVPDLIVSRDDTPSFQLQQVERLHELVGEIEFGYGGADNRTFSFTCGLVTVLPVTVASLAHAQTIDDDWAIHRYGEFPDAVGLERKRLGLESIAGDEGNRP